MFWKNIQSFLDTSEIKEYNTELINEMADALQDARSNEKWRHDYMSIEMLKNECRAEGRDEKGKEDARRMLKKGLDALFVSECVDLPLAVVQALAATL